MDKVDRDARGQSTLDAHKVIGDFTESAVQSYFEASGFSMTRFGVEHIFPQWTDVIVEDAHADPRKRGTFEAFAQQQDFSRFLRSFPDFVAIRTAPGPDGVREIFPVEVKFRTERVFSGEDRPLHTIRLSRESVAGYKCHWPSTLLVVVCYHARSMIGTRVRKLKEVSDSRVPIKESGYRRSWFYNVAHHGFRRLWDFEQGWFDAALGAETVARVITFADQVAQREGLSME